MTVLELIEGLEVRACTGPVATTVVTGVQCDSRLISPGDLFVAVHGTRVHGLRFVDEACAHGRPWAKRASQGPCVLLELGVRHNFV